MWIDNSPIGLERNARASWLIRPGMYRVASSLCDMEDVSLYGLRPRGRALPPLRGPSRYAPSPPWPDRNMDPPGARRWALQGEAHDWLCTL